MIYIIIYIIGYIVAYYMSRHNLKADGDWNYGTFFLNLFIGLFSWISAIMAISYYITKYSDWKHKEPPKWL